MTREQAATVRVGDAVTSTRTGIPLEPIKVRGTWTSGDGAITRFQTARYGWLDASGVELAPRGMKWDTFAKRWAAPVAAGDPKRPTAPTRGSSLAHS